MKTNLKMSALEWRKNCNRIQSIPAAHLKYHSVVCVTDANFIFYFVNKLGCTLHFTHRFVMLFFFFALVVRPLLSQAPPDVHDTWVMMGLWCHTSPHMGSQVSAHRPTAHPAPLWRRSGSSCQLVSRRTCIDSTLFQKAVRYAFEWLGTKPISISSIWVCVQTDRQTDR